MKTKHTPGPWELIDKQDSPTTPHYICVKAGDEYLYKVSCPTEERQFANASLIAAAPEMLELLKSVFGNRKLLNDEHFSGVADKLFKLIDNVITKAEGNETK